MLAGLESMLDRQMNKRSTKPRRAVALPRAALAGMVAALGVAPPATAAPTVPDPALSECTAMGLSACPQPFDATLPPASSMLQWDPAARLIGFRNTYRQYDGDVFHTRGARPYPLPSAATAPPPLRYQMDGKSLGLEDYVERQSVTGLLVLKDGHVVIERYGGGNTPSTLWTSRSVAKSVVSILVGMAIKDGSIHSVADPVTRYLPELAGTAWQDVTLQNLLQHTSGVLWNENYADPASDFAHLTACEAGKTPYPCIIGLLRALKRKPGVAPGEVWSYNTGGAWLVGAVLEHATKMTIARYLETRLWSRFAMQSDGVWQALVKGEIDMGGHGFNATLRDWGRFGLFVANGGRLATGEALLPTGWIKQSTSWTQARGSVTPGAPHGQFGYQWWSGELDPRSSSAAAQRTAEGTFWAEGIYGQGIAINPREHVVMVQWSVWAQANGPDSLYEERSAFFGALSDALTTTPRH